MDLNIVIQNNNSDNDSFGSFLSKNRIFSSITQDSERKMNRSEVSSKWNKCRIYVGDQLDHWNELKEVLRVQTRAEFANVLLDR
jgi:hypothetical protein